MSSGWTKFTDLPMDIISGLATYLDLNDLFNFLRMNRQTSLLAHRANEFWFRRYIRDFGEPKAIVDDWRKEYIDALIGDIYLFGGGKYEPTILTEPKAANVSSGDGYTLILDLEGKIWVTDRSGSGVYSTHVPKSISISSGARHTLIIDSKDNVWVTYSNETRSLNLKAKSVSAGGSHSVIIGLDHSVWVFGDNRYGQLGLGDFTSRDIPTIIPDLKAKAASAGEMHTMLIDLDDNLIVFGSNAYAQLGASPGPVLAPLPSALFPSPIQMKGLKVKSISTGPRSLHSMAIDLDGNVWVAGYNNNGQVGLPDYYSHFVHSFKQIPGIKARQVSAGGTHSLIVDYDFTIWAFGDNSQGQLGTGRVYERHSVQVPTIVGPKSLPMLVTKIVAPQQVPGIKAYKVSAGKDHTAIIARGRSTLTKF